MSKLNRNQQVLTIASSAALSDAYNNVENVAGGIILPSALEATSCIGFEVCDSSGGTFVPLYDEYAALVTMPVAVNAARGYKLPDAVKFWPYFKIWTQNGTGTDVTQTATRTFSVVGIM